jgi:mannose-6-phosphate isomerase-like protein (cupin superfamily)
MRRSVNPQIIDFTQLQLEAGIYGSVFALECADLDCNLVYWCDGEGVPAHAEDDRDVVGIVLHGEGILHMDGVDYNLRPGQFFLIPKRVVRALHSTGDDFVYLTVHRRRDPLMPD